MTLDIGLVVVACIIPFVLIFFNLVVMAHFIDPEAAAGHVVAKFAIVSSSSCCSSAAARAAGASAAGCRLRAALRCVPLSHVTARPRAHNRRSLRPLPTPPAPALAAARHADGRGDGAAAAARRRQQVGHSWVRRVEQQLRRHRHGDGVAGECRARTLRRASAEHPRRASSVAAHRRVFAPARRVAPSPRARALPTSLLPLPLAAPGCLLHHRGADRGRVPLLHLLLRERRRGHGGEGEERGLVPHGLLAALRGVPPQLLGRAGLHRADAGARLHRLLRAAVLHRLYADPLQPRHGQRGHVGLPARRHAAGPQHARGVRGGRGRVPVRPDRRLRALGGHPAHGRQPRHLPRRRAELRGLVRLLHLRRHRLHRAAHRLLQRLLPPAQGAQRDRGAHAAPRADEAQRGAHQDRRRDGGARHRRAGLGAQQEGEARRRQGGQDRDQPLQAARRPAREGPRGVPARRPAELPPALQPARALHEARRGRRQRPALGRLGHPHRHLHALLAAAAPLPQPVRPTAGSAVRGGRARETRTARHAAYRPPMPPPLRCAAPRRAAPRRAGTSASSTPSSRSSGR